MAALSDDLRRHLLERRVVLVSGEIDEGAAGRVAAELMTLDATGDRALVLQLQGVDAGYGPAFSLMDTIDLLGVPVLARCTGVVAGAAIGIVAVSQHRWATEHSSFRLGDPPASAEGTFADLGRWAEELGRTRARFVERLSRALRVDAEDLAADLASGRILDPDQARQAGLIDQVGGSPPQP